MTQPIRILHLLHRLSTGGITNWLVDLARHTDPKAIQFDFAVHRPGETPFLEELRLRGSRVFRLPDRRQVVRYCAHLWRVLRRNGPFQAVHSHYRLFSAVPLTVARLAGVPIRLAHVHKDQGVDSNLRRKPLVDFALRSLLRFSASRCLACSSRAALAVWGPEWAKDSRIEVFPYGFDFSPFLNSYNRDDVLLSIGIPADALVFGHVGNFVPAKNHEFLIHVFRESLQLCPNLYLILVGEGERRPSIEQLCHALGLTERVRFVGFRPDLAKLLAVMDVLVFPSLIEGLPITVLQAQLSGVPVIASTAVPPEADATGLVSFLSLKEPFSVWATQSLEAAKARRTSVTELARRMAKYRIENVAARLSRYYLGKEA